MPSPIRQLSYADFEFCENLGSGEFGQVFRGLYAGQEVAIKQIFYDSSLRPAAVLEELVREIDSFRHLRHPRLVQFIGACLELPHPCLVTEYAPGGSLHFLLHVNKTKLPLRHAANMCLQLNDGVRYLHGQKPCVVHRDLKSLNVVLDLHLNVKICDFGLTVAMERTHITNTTAGGSPRYMAPELFDNKTKISEKVDIWAMGCIFAETLGGDLPYAGINTLAELTREIIVEGRPPAIPLHIPLDFQSVLRHCLQMDASGRPSARAAYEKLLDAKRRSAPPRGAEMVVPDVSGIVVVDCSPGARGGA